AGRLFADFSHGCGRGRGRGSRHPDRRFRPRLPRLAPMRQIVLATRNAKKIHELERILLAAGLEDVGLAGPELYATLPEIPETGLSFAENALIKARAVAAATGLPAVADDSGLCVDALNG